jgi:hypothetical protein
VTIPHQRGPFVTVDEPSWCIICTESTFCIMVCSWCGLFRGIGLHKYIRTCIYHLSCTFTALKILFGKAVHLMGKFKSMNIKKFKICSLRKEL